MVTWGFLQAIHTVCKQHARDLTRISQLAANQAEENLKSKMDLDRAKIESLEAKLTRMHIVAKKFDDELVTTKTTLVTTESWRQKLGETLATTEHQFYQMLQRFEEAE